MSEFNYNSLFGTVHNTIHINFLVQMEEHLPAPALVSAVTVAA
jgi:hypothetical protein